MCFGPLFSALPGPSWAEKFPHRRRPTATTPTTSLLMGNKKRLPLSRFCYRKNQWGCYFCIGLFLPCTLPCNHFLGVEGGGEGEDRVNTSFPWTIKSYWMTIFPKKKKKKKTKQNLTKNFENNQNFFYKNTIFSIFYIWGQKIIINKYIFLFFII